MHRPSPTSITPVRSSGSSGRHIHARASYGHVSVMCVRGPNGISGQTIRKGATTQFTNTLKASCVHISRCEKTSCRVSYRTLQRMGYIITSSPTAILPEQPASQLVSDGQRDAPTTSASSTSWREKPRTNRHTDACELALLERCCDVRHEVA